tara:strand:+ start:1666 stop:1881 length:216 start_codon:yes stop_codon:yes gene_type:complete
MQNLIEKIHSLSVRSLITVLLWIINDLNNAANSSNYANLDEKVKGWCAMLLEAVEYQVDKEIKRNNTIEEE